MVTKAYQDILRKLNTAQLEAVEHIDGPLMIVAGPGTGKTHVLAARIGKIIESTDTPPYAILALTYTDSAANTMKQRVVRMIGKSGYYVNVQTFHSFCSDVIQAHPEYFYLDRHSVPLSPLEKFEIMQACITDTPLKVLRPVHVPFFYVREVSQAIAHLKRESVSPETFEQIIQEEFDEAALGGLSASESSRRYVQRDKNKELLLLYRAYQSLMKKRNRYDFEDMISFVTHAFAEHSLLLREYQERLHYILVDEYQDTNASQNMILQQLASYWDQEANICVVGDPHQSIYRFQGASIENSLGFIDTYPQARIVTLDTGYRCSQSLYDAAYALIQENKLTQTEHSSPLYAMLHTTLKSVTEQGSPLIVCSAPSPSLEVAYVADTISALTSRGVAYENIAILVRRNAECLEIADALAKYDLPTEIDGGHNILRSEHIRQLLQLMRVIHDTSHGTDSEAFFEVMMYPWVHVPQTSAMKMGRAAGKLRTTIPRLIEQGYEQYLSQDSDKSLTPQEFESVRMFFQQLTTWAAEESAHTFTQWFEQLIHESGFLAHALRQKNSPERILEVNALFREIKLLTRENVHLALKQFITSVDTMLQQGIHIEADDGGITRGAVHISTVHKAKGREWDYVFVMNCVDGVWGNTRHKDLIPLPKGLLKNTDISKKEKNEDDRRLFYVALTRARHNCILTYPSAIPAYGGTQATVPSMFIEELPERYRNATKFEAEPDLVTRHTAIQLTKHEGHTSTSEEEFLDECVAKFSLSVTALNTYLRDPAEFVRVSLLRLPQAPKLHFSFGRAVHAALEAFNTHSHKGTILPIQDVLTSFERALVNERLTDSQLTEAQERGTEFLTGYYHQRLLTASAPLFVEKQFGRGWSKTVLDDISLTGRVDKIELVSKQDKHVRVVDYKTGSSKSMNMICGTVRSAPLSERERALPESIRGSYKRQLLFYKLLTQLDRTFPFTVTEGSFEFVKPEKSGKYTQRILALTNEDTHDLAELIREVMGEIRSLAFMDAWHSSINRQSP